MEHYLSAGSYSVVRIEEQALGVAWARLEHSSGDPIDGHETVWVQLQDQEDRDFALRRYLQEQFAGRPKPAFGG
jgi:hypothetical protein